MLSKFYKPFWLVTGLLFFITFIWGYAYLGESIAYYQNEITGRTSDISRDNFFFGGLSIFVISNLLLYVFTKLLNATFHVSKEYLKLLSNWFIVLAGIFNSFFFLSILLIVLFNRNAQHNPFFFAILFYLTAAAVILWMIRLVIIILQSK